MENHNSTEILQVRTGILIRSGFIELIVAAAATVMVLWVAAEQKTDFLADGMGAAMGVDTWRHEGLPVHATSPGDIPAVVKGVRARRLPDLTLMLGNSQLHAVNQYAEGDELASGILFRDELAGGRDFVTVSLPNANLQEHQLILEQVSAVLPVRRLVLPLVFDDLRENGIRNELQALYQTGDKSGEKVKQSEPGLRDKSEAAIERLLRGSIFGRAVREEVRGQVDFALYRLRNTVFNIQATTVRKMIPHIMDRNLQSLAAILALCKQKHIQVLLYIAPVLQEPLPPYDPADYAAFKQRVSAMASDTVTFADLDTLIPVPEWGTKESTSLSGGEELDFMHFTGAGQRRLAAKIAALLHGMARSQGVAH